MAKKKLSEIVCIIDRSGSMASVVDDAIGGLNTFIEEQKKVPGKALITTILFDHEYIVFHDGVKLEDVKPFDNKTYVPRGNTALLDAMGRGIATAKERIRDLPKAQQPSKVIVTVLTDGFENASREYNKDKITKMIEEQRKEKWEFIFLAANEQTIGDAIHLGFHRHDTVAFQATGAGTRAAYGSMSNLTANYRKKQ